MFSCRLFCLKLFILLIFLYFLAHFLLNGQQDLGWMPPPPDLTFVTDSPKKKHPDGPLVLKEGILEEEGGKGRGRKGSNKLVKAVLMESPVEMEINEGGEGNKGRRRRKLPISEQFLAKFRQTAKQMHQRHFLQNGFILFSLINRAYLDLTLNWLCNIYALPGGQNATAKAKKGEEGNGEMLKGTLLVAMDGGELCKELKRSWPQVVCLSLFEKQRKNLASGQLDADEQKAYNEALSWGRLRYVHILTARANLMAALSEAKVPFVLAESDAIWLRNPMSELFAKANLVEDADLMMPLNSPKDSSKGQRFAFDPMVVFVTNGSRRALQEMRRVLNAEQGTMDQDLLNQLCAQQYGGLVCREFAIDEVGDGAWFKLSEPERGRAAQKAGHWPFVVNNNFYVGVQNKMARQAINGFWFLSAKQKQCNLSKTRRILQKYQKKP